MTDRHDRWVHFVDLATIIWLVIFALEVAGRGPPYGLWIELALSSVFIADLAATYSRSESAGAFIRKHWTDILLAIPFVRVFRLTRARRVQRLFRLIKRVGQLLGRSMKLEDARRNIMRAWDGFRRWAAHLFPERRHKARRNTGEQDTDR